MANLCTSNAQIGDANMLVNDCLQYALEVQTLRERAGKRVKESWTESVIFYTRIVHEV